jgi:hypothetical protein
MSTSKSADYICEACGGIKFKSSKELQEHSLQEHGGETGQS